MCLQVWACETLREQFLTLPFSAVRCLLGSDATAVAAENTVLVALTGWVEEGSHGRSTTGAQRKELLSLVSECLEYCSPCFVVYHQHRVTSTELKWLLSMCRGGLLVRERAVGAICSRRPPALPCRALCFALHPCVCAVCVQQSCSITSMSMPVASKGGR